MFLRLMDYTLIALESDCSCTSLLMPLTESRPGEQAPQDHWENSLIMVRRLQTAFPNNSLMEQNKKQEGLSHQTDHHPLSGQRREKKKHEESGGISWTIASTPCCDSDCDRLSFCSSFHCYVIISYGCMDVVVFIHSSSQDAMLLTPR